MAEDQTTPESTENEAPAGAAAYTDDQLAEAFPNQDIEHVRSMLDKAAGIHTPADPNADGDTNETPAADTPAEGDPQADSGETEVEYPDYIPEKFRKGSVEEATRKMAEAYSTLERARGGSDNAADGDGDGAVADDGSDQPAGDSPKVDLMSMEQRFIDAGNQITDEMRADAAKAGIAPEVLETFINGQQAIANQLITKVHDMVGGPENYEAMMQWMVGNMSEADVAAYDAAMGTGNEANISMAVRAAQASYQAAVGKDAQSSVDPQNGAKLADGFQSKREMIDAMRDPRYAKDPAYRKEVERRISTGNVW